MDRQKRRTPIKKRKKGEYGYIKWKKTEKLLLTLGMAVIGLAIFIVGYYFSKKTTANYFTILAVLMVLPGAKHFTAFLVLFPYHTASMGRYERIRRYVRDDNALLMDLVITSNEKVMNLDALILMDQKAYGLIGKKGQDITYITDYLTKHATRYVEGYGVRIVEDENEYCELLDGEVDIDFYKTKEGEEMIRDIMTLIVS